MSTSITSEQAQARRGRFENVSPFYTMSSDSKFARQDDDERRHVEVRVATEGQAASTKELATV